MEINKQAIKALCISHLDKKLLMINNALKETQSSSNRDTKSSAGDKHETSRAMAHIENERLAKQLNNLQLLKTALNKIDVNHKITSVVIGSYVITQKGNFFISVGLGKINANEYNFYAIAIHSPVGKSLIGKKVGDDFVMGSSNVKIEKIV